MCVFLKFFQDCFLGFPGLFFWFFQDCFFGFCRIVFLVFGELVLLAVQNFVHSRIHQ